MLKSAPHICYFNEYFNVYSLASSISIVSYNQDFLIFVQKRTDNLLLFVNQHRSYLLN